MSAIAPATPSRRIVRIPRPALRAIDVDLHHHDRRLAGRRAVRAAGLAPPSRAPGRPAAGAPRLQDHRAALRRGPAPDRRERQGRHPAADPAWVKERVSRPARRRYRHPDRAVLSLGVQPNPDMAAAIATAVNDWTLETWVRPFSCFKGSILIAQQDPVQAVAEIDRLGDDPGMVQVLMGSASEAPLGRRQFHPIYEACVAPQPAARPAHRRRGRRDVAAVDGGRPPDDLLRVVRLAAAGLHGPHHEHGHRGRLREVPDAQGRPLRGRHLLAAAHHVALRQELEGAARRDAVGEGAAERLHPPALLLHDLPARAEQPGRARRRCWR